MHHFRALDLGDDARLAAACLHQAACVVNVLGAQRKRDRHVVESDFRGVANVFAVAFGQRGGRESATETVQALAIRQPPAHPYPAFDPGAMHREHFEADAPVIEDQHIAGRHTLGKARQIATDPFMIAVAIGQRAVEHEACALDELRRSLAETADADLRALQIAEQRHLVAGAGCQSAYQRGARPMIVRAAMGKIQPEHIHAGLDQRADDLFGTAGRAERGDDLGASPEAHAGCSCCSTARPSTRP